MQITKISTQVKNQNAVNVFVDGKFYRGLDKIVALRLGLKAGLTLTPKLIDELEQTHSANRAFEYALRLLARSPKSEAEMQKKLKDKFGEEFTTETISRLLSANLLGDREYAKSLVARFALEEQLSVRQIKQKLATKKFPPNLIREALADLAEDHDERAAGHVLRKRFKGAPYDPKTKQKCLGYLAQRGFSYSAAKAAVDQLALANSQHLS